MSCKNCFNCVVKLPIHTDPLQTKLTLPLSGSQRAYCREKIWMNNAGEEKTFTYQSVMKNGVELQEEYRSCMARDEVGNVL